MSFVQKSVYVFGLIIFLIFIPIIIAIMGELYPTISDISTTLESSSLGIASWISIPLIVFVGTGIFILGGIIFFVLKIRSG